MDLYVYYPLVHTRVYFLPRLLVTVAHLLELIDPTLTYFSVLVRGQQASVVGEQGVLWDVCWPLAFYFEFVSICPLQGDSGSLLPVFMLRSAGTA